MNPSLTLPILTNWAGPRLARLVLVLALAGLPLLTALAAAERSAPPPPAHPALLALAASNPDASVGVIIQTTTGREAIADQIARLGGTVTHDLSIIRAMAAEVPARSLPILARAHGVRWISPNGGVIGSGDTSVTESFVKIVEGFTQQNTYLDTTGARRVWGLGRQGQGIGVAVIDSGVTADPDFGARLTARQMVNAKARSLDDTLGHGTHVAGIIAGNGADSNGLIQGVAPAVNLLGLKVSDDKGNASEADVVAAMQWVYQNKAAHNIRVVNLSINSSVEQSYHLSPLNAAAEILWFNGIVVIASAGNGAYLDGAANTIRTAPANDPFIITVGASTEYGTSDPNRHTLAPFSAAGTTQDGFAKPDIIAPGTAIVSVLATTSPWAKQYPQRVEGQGQYFKLSGTSMAAPMVAGAAALLLQDEPGLTPDQVKYRLMATGSRAFTINGRAVPYLNVYNAVTGTTTRSANTGVAASQLLWTGSEPVVWTSVHWNSVDWNAVHWNAVHWNAVRWNAVHWNSVDWSK